jgi:ParB family transcriptional regulator, chromosome partitioning protein
LISIDAYVEESLPVNSIKSSRILARESEVSPARDNTVRELASSVHQHGLLNPIIVRPVEDGFEIVAGNRRFEACRILHWKYIPAKVKELSEKDAFEIQLIENIQRKTMNPIEEAKAFKKYTTEFGWGGESQLARIISRSEQYVSNRIQLLRLPKTVIDEISRTRLKVSHAQEIINLDENEQKIINDAIISENLTVRDIRDLTKHSKLNKRKKVEGEAMQQEPEISENITDSSNDSIRQQTKVIQKAQLCLRVSLYRLDSLIHESSEKLNGYDHSEVNDILMQFRLEIHSMLDESIRTITKLNKKLR